MTLSRSWTIIAYLILFVSSLALVAVICPPIPTLYYVYHATFLYMCYQQLPTPPSPMTKLVSCRPTLLS